MNEPPHPVLAQGQGPLRRRPRRARLAETPDQAKDAAELIDVDYDVLPAVVNCVDALEAGRAADPRRRAGQQVLHVGARRQGRGRRGVRQGGARDEARHRQQPPHPQRDRAARGGGVVQPRRRQLHALRHEPEPARRAAADDGVRAGPARAQGARDRARRRRRLRLEDLPVSPKKRRWSGRRSASTARSSGRPSAARSFLSDAHGRDHVTHAELALDKDGKFLALRVHTTAAMGAYLSTFASCIPTILYATLLAGQYTTPAIYCEVTAVFTNTAPVDAYRGAGRPEATYVVERIVHQAAVEIGIAQDEIRRRNFIRELPVPDAGRAHLRHRRLRRDARRRDEDRRRRGLSRRARRKRRSAASCAGSATRRTSRPAAIAPSNVAGALGARAGPVRGGRGARASHRQRDGVHRLAQPRPGPRDDVRAGRRGAPRHPDRERRRRARRHRPRAVRHGHLRLALARGRRHGDRQGARQDRRQGQEDRRAPAGGGGDRHRVQGRQVHRRRHRPQQDVRRDRADRLRAAQLSARQARAGPRRDRVLRPDQLHLPGGHAHLRSRDRSGHRRGRGRRLHRMRRLRQHHQSDDRRGPGARRPRAGHRPGAARALRLRRARAASS